MSLIRSVNDDLKCGQFAPAGGGQFAPAEVVNINRQVVVRLLWRGLLFLSGLSTESLLYAIINGLALKKGIRIQRLDFINLSISSQNKNRIPYIFCHGTLPIPDCTVKKNKKFITDDKLVFLEKEYLHLANNAFSWQSNSFMEIINSCTVIFIGVSLTDPNMRRWLSWTHSTRVEEIKMITHDTDIDSTKHYWINKTPTDVALKNWIEASVSHLGIRLIWIDDWNRIESVLNKLIKN